MSCCPSLLNLSKRIWSFGVQEPKWLATSLPSLDFGHDYGNAICWGLQGEIVHRETQPLSQRRRQDRLEVAGSRPSSNLFCVYKAVAKYYTVLRVGSMSIQEYWKNKSLTKRNNFYFYFCLLLFFIGMKIKGVVAPGMP
jgi:hypothetical protein